MTSNNAFAARTCIVGVVVTNGSNMASYFPEGENLNGSITDMCSGVTGPSSSGSGYLCKLSDRSDETDPESLNRATQARNFLPPSWI